MTVSMVPVLDGLRDIAGSYDGFILDLWGVIHDGSSAYPGAVDSLARLSRLGKRTVMLSNAPRRAASLIDLMASIGIARHLYGDVMCSGEAVHEALLQRTDPAFAALGPRCLHVGSDRDKRLFDGLRLDFVTGVEDADFLLNTGPDRIEETVADYAPLLDAAAARGLPMVCANPDLVVIRQGREYICAGMLARYYESIGGVVHYRGKPDPAIYKDCLRLLAVSDRRRVITVGDGFPTDVAGAKAAGLDCLFVTGGIHAAEIGTRYGERPDPAAVERAIATHGNLRPTAAIGGFVW
jgi:HAD superfamily hydrolase (TIGR01459 family)